MEEEVKVTEQENLEEISEEVKEKTQEELNIEFIQEFLQKENKKVYYCMDENFTYFVEIYGIIYKDNIREENSSKVVICSVIDTKVNQKEEISLRKKEDFDIKEDVTKKIFYIKDQLIYNSLGFFTINFNTLHQAIDWKNKKEKFYKSMFELFKENSINTRIGKMLDCEFYLYGYKGSILIEQKSNQANKNLYILYINYKQKEVTQVLDSSDTFRFLCDICVENNSKLIEESIELFKKRDKLIISEFFFENFELCKSAIAYRYIGLKENKIQREETKLLEKLFQDLQITPIIDKNGNIIYVENTEF